MDKTTFEESVQNVENLAKEIRTMGGEEKPVIVLTAVDGCLQAYCHGKANELTALITTSMIRRESWRTIVCRAADAALEYIEKHPECTEDEE